MKGAINMKGIGNKINKVNIIGIIFMALIAMNSCKKDNVIQDIPASIKQQNSTDIVIITEAEKQFLTNSMSIDDFKKGSKYIVYITTKMSGKYFVGAMNGENVLFAGIDRKTHPDWVKRLHEYFEIAKKQTQSCVAKAMAEEWLFSSDASEVSQWVVDHLADGWCITICYDAQEDLYWCYASKDDQK